MYERRGRVCGLGKYFLPGLSHRQAKLYHFSQEEAFQVMDQMAQAGGAHMPKDPGSPLR